MIYHCPKCGAACKSLFFDRRNKIIFCDVCAREITEFKLEEEEHEPVRTEGRVLENAGQHRG